MKHFFTLFFLMLGTTVFAQSYVFCDKDGNVIENGATLERTELINDGFDNLIKSGLYVMNQNAPENYQVSVKADITRIDNGAVQLCFPTNCYSYTTTGTHGGDAKGTVPLGEKQDIQSEWFPTAYGECIVTYTLTNYQGAFPKNTLTATVHYKYADPSGIRQTKGIQQTGTREWYDLLGRQTTASHRGLTIVRMSDGSVKKVSK